MGPCRWWLCRDEIQTSQRSISENRSSFSARPRTLASIAADGPLSRKKIRMGKVMAISSFVFSFHPAAPGLLIQRHQTTRPRSLGAKGLHGLESRGAPRRIQAREDADERCGPETDGDGCGMSMRGPAADPGNQGRAVLAERRARLGASRARVPA